QALVQHAQTHRSDALGKMIVVGSNGQAGVADAWFGSNLGNGRSRCALPANLVDASTARHQPDALAGLHVLAHRRSAVAEAVRDAADAAAGVPLHQDLLYVRHQDPPAPHRPPPPSLRPWVAGTFYGPVSGKLW